MKLSIITINLNNKIGLLKTIDSVIQQKGYDLLEFIIVDGLSSDGSHEIISCYESKISKVIIEKDTGIYNAMNKGLIHSTGEYLLFLNSADVLYDNNTISRSLPLLQEADLIIGLTEYKNNDTGECILTELPETGCDLNYLIKASLPHQSTFIRRELLSDGYDETIKIGGDWKFFLEVVCRKMCSIKILDQVITKFDMNGISTNPNNYKEIDEEKADILWQLFRYDYNEWRRIENRVKTADYYEQLWIMKCYFAFNRILRSQRKRYT